MKIFPYGSSGSRDVLVQDHPDRAVVRVGNTVFRRVSPSGPFPSLRKLESSRTVTKKIENIPVANVTLQAKHKIGN